MVIYIWSDRWRTVNFLQKLIAVPKIILSEYFKTTFKQNLTCMTKSQQQLSFVHFVVNDPVYTTDCNIFFFHLGYVAHDACLVTRQTDEVTEDISDSNTVLAASPFDRTAFILDGTGKRTILGGLWSFYISFITKRNHIFCKCLYFVH